MSEQEPPPELVKVGRDLSEIVLLHETLGEQAIHKAADSDMPGGMAMVMLAPVADPETYGNLIDHAEQTGADLSHIDDEDPDNWEPPLQTLLFWSEAWRYEHGNVTDLRPTVGSEAAYLRGLLNWAWEHEPHWRDFAADIRKAKARLEATLYAGDRAERTRVPCIDCTHPPMLIKVYAGRDDDCCHGRSDHSCPHAKRDHFCCPRCKLMYDADAYRRAKHHHLASQGAARFVKLQDAIAAIERPERTVCQWVTDLRVRTMCDVASRQRFAWWPDVRDCDLDTPNRRVS